jgi:hypothetical protein
MYTLISIIVTCSCLVHFYFYDILKNHAMYNLISMMLTSSCHAYFDLYDSFKVVSCKL